MCVCGGGRGRARFQSVREYQAHPAIDRGRDVLFHREEVFVVAPLFALLDFVNLFQWDHSQRVLFLERRERDREDRDEIPFLTPKLLLLNQRITLHVKLKRKLVVWCGAVGLVVQRDCDSNIVVF